MSEQAAATHTPGPWRQDEPGSLLVVAGEAKSKDDIVAGCWGHRDAEGVANARLIAAAPEMLALLRNLHADLARYSKMTEEVWSSGSIAFASYADDCARLIAKAEGRTL